MTSPPSRTPRTTQWGAVAANLYGIDLIAGRIAYARERLPGADLRWGDARHLPWRDGSFDLVTQFTVFSSILDTQVQAEVAAEMLRVLRIRTPTNGRQETISRSAACAPMSGIAANELRGDRETRIEVLARYMSGNPTYRALLDPELLKRYNPGLIPTG